jgi:two-component system CheB/CheR fusion protein
MVRAQSQLVEDMLDVSRARTGRLAIDRQLLPLTYVVADSIGALRKEAEQKGVAVEVDIGDAPLVGAADRVRVRQIAWNLLTNALKFTPAGGTIRVSLRREGDEARLDVVDTGQGIAAEFIPHVFDWFRSAGARTPGAKSGMGIGLALVRHLVELHGGRVEAFSEGVGKGARFTVRLPLQESVAEMGPAAINPDTRVRRLDGTAILVVDDMAANAESLRDVLTLEGASVDIALSGPEAIEHARRRRFDAVICDIGMPDMSGHEIAKAIAACPLNAATPAIAYSGYSGPDEVRRALETGFKAHITKPADLERLVAAVTSATAAANEQK